MRTRDLDRADGWNAPENAKLRRTVIVMVCALGITLVGFGALMEHQSAMERQRWVAAENAFTVSAENSLPRVAEAFRDWRTSTGSGQDVLDWSGATASVIWIDKQVFQYQRLAQFVVLAVTPNGRFFKVVFEMRDSEDLKLASRLPFGEMKAEDVVRALNARGRPELIEKLGLSRSPA